jgi:hypothetical protein
MNRFFRGIPGHGWLILVFGWMLLSVPVLEGHAAPSEPPLDQSETSESVEVPVSPESTLSKMASSVSSASEDTTGTERRLQVLQARMETLEKEYNARLQQMQDTIARLTIQISKTGASPIQDVRPLKPTDPSDQDIGEELIFGSEDLADTAPAPLTAVPALPTAPRSGFGIGGRSVLNGLTQPFSTSGAALGQTFNPDIMVTGDFVGQYGNRRSGADRNRIRLRETEFGFSAAVDPYAKAAFVFSRPDDEEGVELEEGYVTLLALPYGLQAKVGRMRSPFGKMNVIHGHDLPQTDRPPVYESFFGEEGLVESGVSLSKVLPTPWFSSLDVQLANGDTKPFFGRGAVTKPLVVGRWKNFFELSDTQTVEVGFSGAVGARDRGALKRLTSVQGVDLTYRWLPPSQFNALIWQTELLSAQLEHPAGDVANSRMWGGYSFLEYKLNNRWSVGVRTDYTERPELADAGQWSVAPYLNFWESEFGRWRLEYKHNFGNQQIRSSDQAWIQYSIILGLHPPHTF